MKSKRDILLIEIYTGLPTDSVDNFMMQYEPYIYSVDDKVALNEYLERTQRMIDELLLKLEI